MPRQTKSARLATVHEGALKTFDAIQTAVKDERMQCLKDRRFYSIAGAQWEGKLSDQFKNKPMLEVNKIHLAIIRIINEYRHNRITVDFKDTGTGGGNLSDLCDGLYRADEQDSGADEAYDNAFEEAVGGGMGAWRIRADYEDDEDPEDDRQRLRIEPIYDADSCVFFDLGAKRQDKSDSTEGFVLFGMTPDAYKEKYGDDPTTWGKDINQTEFDWCTGDVVYIAEYYKVEKTKKPLHIYEHLDGETERFNVADLTDEKEHQLEAAGAKHVRTRQIVERKVHKYVLSGKEVLEDCGYIAGKNIPIVVTYGKRWYVDNVERCMGHVRLAIGAQQLKNMQISKLGELAAMSGVETPIFTPEQVQGHTDAWKNHNIENYAYLLLNPIEDANSNEQPIGPLGYTKPPAIPPALAALLQLTEEDIQDLLGNQQDGEMMTGNIAQGTAELIQTRLDMQVYIYVSNFSKAMKRGAEIWLSMAQDTIVEEGRKMKTITRDGTVGDVTMLQKQMDDKSGVIYANDLTKSKFDVIPDVGPASSTKKAATVRSLTNMLNATTDEETRQILSAMIMMNSEGEGVQDATDYFRKKLVTMGVIPPTPEEAEEMKQAKANAEPTPEDKYLESSANKEQQLADKAQADTELSQAKTHETQAKTAEIVTGIDATEQQQALEVIDRLQSTPNTGGDQPTP